MAKMTKETAKKILESLASEDDEMGYGFDDDGRVDEKKCRSIVDTHWAMGEDEDAGELERDERDAIETLGLDASYALYAEKRRALARARRAAGGRS